MLTRPIFRLLSVLLVSMAVLTACGPDSFGDRRDMYGISTRSPRVRLDVDWMSRFGKRPTGMTVMMSGEDKKCRTETTNDVDGTELRLDKGKYGVLVYNLSPDEYGSLDFYKTDSFDSLYVRLTPITRPNRAWDDSMHYLGPPEPLAIARDTIEITDSMVETYNRIARLSDSGHRDTLVYHFLEKPQPVMTTLTVTVRVKGLKYASSLEGNITGMADGYHMMPAKSTDGECNMLLDDWKFHTDSIDPDYGIATTSAITFGLPNCKCDLAKRDSTDTWVTLHFKLVDGKTEITLKYPVGKDFKYIIHDSGHMEYTTELTLNLDLSIHYEPELPKVTPSGDSKSGFDAHVDDWDDGGTSDIIL